MIARLGGGPCLSQHFVSSVLILPKTVVKLVVRPNGEHWPSALSAADVPTLVRRCATVHPDLIVCEATGGYEVGVVSALAVAALPVVVVNPR